MDYGALYEHSCVYVDELIFIGTNAMKYLDPMKYEWNLEGRGHLKYYHGEDLWIE